MTLKQVFERAREDGYNYAGDSVFCQNRKLEDWADEMRMDTANYEYYGGFASQRCDEPSNEWRFWKMEGTEKINERKYCLCM
jgi:hypothetical protein